MSSQCTPITPQDLPVIVNAAGEDCLIIEDKSAGTTNIVTVADLFAQFGGAIDINVSNFTYDPLTKEITITETDGSTHTIDVTDLVNIGTLCEQAEALLPGSEYPEVTQYIGLNPETTIITLDVLRPIPDEIQITMTDGDVSAICAALTGGVDFQFEILDGALAGTYIVPVASILGSDTSGCPASVIFTYSLTGGGLFPGAVGNEEGVTAVMPGATTVCQLVKVTEPVVPSAVNLGNSDLSQTDPFRTYDGTDTKQLTFQAMSNLKINPAFDAIIEAQRIRLATPAVTGFTATAGEVFTLVNPGTGEGEWAAAVSPKVANGLSVDLVTGDIELGGGLIQPLTVIDGAGAERSLHFNGIFDFYVVGTQNQIRLESASGTGIHIDLRIAMKNLPVFADNASALGGGLAVDDVYKTATGDLRIVV